MPTRKCKTLSRIEDPEKYSIIGRDIHRLVKIKKGEDWSMHPWRIHERGNLFWVPVENQIGYVQRLDFCR